MFRGFKLSGAYYLEHFELICPVHTSMETIKQENF
jgi:hypothetical protein